MRGLQRQPYHFEGRVQQAVVRRDARHERPRASRQGLGARAGIGVLLKQQLQRRLAKLITTEDVSAGIVCFNVTSVGAMQLSPARRRHSSTRPGGKRALTTSRSRTASERARILSNWSEESGSVTT